MNKRTWYIDMDDTICDYSGQFNEDLNLEPKIAYPQSQYGFYSKLKPLPNAIESLKELDSLGEDVWILTRPSVNNPLCYTDKFLWVREHLGVKFANRLILTTDKGRVGTENDILIDDFDWKTPREVEDVSPWKGTQILFGSDEFENWEKVIKYIKLKKNEK